MVVWGNTNYSSNGYVAPTVYLKQGVTTIPRWRYYRTFAEASAAYSGNYPPTSAGYVSFLQNGTGQTFGVNVDFFVLQSGKWVPVNYSYMKENNSPKCIVRIFTPQGDGAFYAVFEPVYFGLTATVVGDYSAEKIAALDKFYREVYLLKFRYNALVGFLNEMSKRQLTPTEQQIFNEGLLKLQSLSNQMTTIEGIEFTFTQSGTVGIPILLIIAIIAILSAVAGWTIASILEEQEKTKRINDSYELNRWIAEKKLQVAQAATSGSITNAQAADINRTLDNAAAIGNKVATDSSTPGKSALGEIGTIVKWGVVGFLVFTGYKLLKKPDNANT